MKAEKENESITRKNKGKGNSEDMEHLNNKRKLQNKVLRKIIENLNNQSTEAPENE